MRRIAPVVALLLLAGITAAGAGYVATFDGTPASPLAFSSPDFDVQLHSRDMNLATVPNAQHGPDCAAPPATHSQQGGVFICNNHVMTTLNEGGYGLIMLTPDQMLDFAASGTVSFELSTERLSTRDWWDLTVSPFLDTQALPLLSDLAGCPGACVDLQGPNKNSIVITTDNLTASPNLKVVRSGVVAAYGGSFAFNAGVTAPNQAATRQTFKLTLSPTTVRFERIASSTASALVFVNQIIPALSWMQGVVQFGHHSYNPEKDNAGVPGTDHWDTFAIDPAIPFTITHFPTRSITANGTITANAPAPANSYLRFAGICKPIVNGVSPPKMVSSGHPEHFSSYLMPIAAGTQNFAVSFSADSWYTPGFGCAMQDYSIWSLGSSLPTPTPTASPTPTPSPTPSPFTYSCIRSDGTVIWAADPGPRSCP